MGNKSELAVVRTKEGHYQVRDTVYSEDGDIMYIAEEPVVVGGYDLEHLLEGVQEIITAIAKEEYIDLAKVEFEEETIKMSDVNLGSLH